MLNFLRGADEEHETYLGKTNRIHSYFLGDGNLGSWGQSVAHLAGERDLECAPKTE